MNIRFDYPFRREIRFVAPISPDETSDRLTERVLPLKLGEGFYDTLKARGTVMGFVLDGRFEIHEAMFGFVGASAQGTISLKDGRSEIHCLIEANPYIRYGFYAVSVIYAVICFIFGTTIIDSGISFGRMAAFIAYSAVYAGAWYLAVRDMKHLREFFEDFQEAANNGENRLFPR